MIIDRTWRITERNINIVKYSIENWETKMIKQNENEDLKYFRFMAFLSIHDHHNYIRFVLWWYLNLIHSLCCRRCILWDDNIFTSYVFTWDHSCKLCEKGILMQFLLLAWLLKHYIFDCWHWLADGIISFWCEWNPFNCKDIKSWMNNTGCESHSTDLISLNR